MPAFAYIASIIENDRRSKVEVYNASGVAEVLIIRWYNDILRVFGMKIICHDGHVTKVLEGQYDDF